jgi:queuine tRNA-ribosyltransferase
VTLPTKGFSFTVQAEDGAARTATFVTPRATIETPMFMPVGTQASVKSLTPSDVEATGARIILANTYHLWLRPGAELVDKMGGVPEFMGWPHAMLTDSGGYQVFSLADRRVIDEDGVTFRSHLDGSKKRLTPEESMRVQRLLRSDVAMVLDVCPPGGAGRDEVTDAMKKTTAWAKRCLATEAYEGQARFGIVQGGVHLDLRKAHLEDIAALPFDGIAMGGFSVGEPVETMYALLAELGRTMPRDKPRYVMGIGTPVDLLEAVTAGVDMFDCVMPTRNARNGQLFTAAGKLNIRRAENRNDPGPPDPACGCPTCTRFSRAYLRHLHAQDDPLFGRLATLHNLAFFHGWVARMRQALVSGTFAAEIARMRAQNSAASSSGDHAEPHP